MIETSVAAWLGFAALLLVASLAGLALGRVIPWSAEARRAGLPLASAMALAPFLAGLGAIAALALAPGATHTTHLAIVAGWLLLAGAGGTIAGWHSALPACASGPRAPARFANRTVRALVLLWALAMLINAIFLPLTQNDSLEYATVGRLLYETRDLASYPALDPQRGSSGFFGPWTHPPLYAALIYLTHLLQGHADAPGLMRLIAPWFALAATGLVYAMGALHSRLTGSVAALIFISTPLFFLGADSALIDALPILGFALVLAAVFGTTGSAAWRGAIIGTLTGLALWTHSQAVLFLPLALAAVVLHGGWADWRARARECLALLALALAVAAWPYLRNVLLFGSPISDNPAVFALPELAWGEYFRIARGLDNGTAILQYGVFKGWFALEAYGWTFWLVILGMAALLRGFPRTALAQGLSRGGSALAQRPGIVWTSAGIALIYLCGVVASIAIGLDLMIRNERYLLVLLPAAAIVGGYGVVRILEWGAARVIDPAHPLWRREAHFVLAVLLMLVLLTQLVLVGWHYRWRYAPPAETYLLAEERPDEPEVSRFERILSNFLNVRAMQWAAKTLPEDALVLSLRPADMYYAGRRMVSYLDPRLIPVYREKDPTQAAELLKTLGVTHVHLPDYSLPPLYNTVLQQVLADPGLTTILHASGGTQVYELRDSDRTASNPRDITPGAVPWTRFSQILIGGRKVMGALGIRAEVLRQNRAVRAGFAPPIFHRDFSTMLAPGIGSALAGARVENLLPVEGEREYRIELRLRGSGFVRVWLLQMDAGGGVIAESIQPEASRIGEIVLGPQHPVQDYARRFVALPSARYVRFGVEFVGNAVLQVETARMDLVGP